MQKNQYEVEYEKYYHKPSANYRQVAANCFDFNFSYQPDDADTCYCNYDNPCKCKVLNNEYCDLLAKQLGTELWQINEYKKMATNEKV